MKTAFDILKNREKQKLEAYKKFQFINEDTSKSSNEWEKKLKSEKLEK